MSKRSDLLLTLGLLGSTALGLTGLYLWLRPKTAGQLGLGERFSSSSVMALLLARAPGNSPNLGLPRDLCFRVATLATPQQIAEDLEPARGNMVLAAVVDDARAGLNDGKGPVFFYSRDVVEPCTQPPSTRRLPTPTPAPPPRATPASFPTPIGVVQPMPQTRMDLGSSFPMVTGRNYKIFERPVDPRKLLPPFLRSGMRVTAIFLDPADGTRETSVTYTGPSDNVPFGPPQATGVFVGVQDDVVAV